VLTAPSQEDGPQDIAEQKRREFKARLERLSRDDVPGLKRLAVWAKGWFLHAEVKLCWEKVLAAAPEDREARLTLGYVWHDGTWYAGEFVDEVLRGKRDLEPEDARRRQAADEELVAFLTQAIGARPALVRDADFRVISFEGEARAKENLRTAREARTQTARVLGETPARRYWLGVADEYVFRNREQYLAFNEKVLPRYTSNPMWKARVGDLRQLQWCTASPPISATVASDFDSNRVMIHHVANQVLAGYIGRDGTAPAYLLEGWAYDLEFMIHGTVEVVLRSRRESKRVSRRPETWRKRLMDDFQHYGRPVTLSRLKYLLRSELSDHGYCAASWAFIRFLRTRHAAEFRRWIRLHRRYRSDEALFRATGRRESQLEREWAQWLSEPGQ